MVKGFLILCVLWATVKAYGYSRTHVRIGGSHVIGGGLRLTRPGCDGCYHSGKCYPANRQSIEGCQVSFCSVIQNGGTINKKFKSRFDPRICQLPSYAWSK